MDMKKQDGSSYSSSSSSSFDHIFGPKGSSSSTTGLFRSIFPPPSPVIGRQTDMATQVGAAKYQTPPDEVGGSKRSEIISKDKSYENETAEPCYLSSSIYYGGQENYSSRTNKTGDSHHVFKKDGKDDDQNGSDSRGASRGNWWEGSLYY